MKKLTSGRLQDLEAVLKMIKESGKTFRFIYKVGTVQFINFGHLLTDKEWIKSLEFEIKQEKENIRFYNNLRKGNGKI